MVVMAMVLTIVTALTSSASSTDTGPLTNPGPCFASGAVYYNRTCLKAFPARPYGFPRTTPDYKSFLADAADFCQYAMYGGHLVAAGSPDWVQVAATRIPDGWNPASPYVVFGGTGVYLSDDNFYVYVKASGTIEPATPGLHNESNTDVLCQARAPNPCGPHEAYVNFDGDADAGPPACVSVLAPGDADPPSATYTPSDICAARQLRAFTGRNVGVGSPAVDMEALVVPLWTELQVAPGVDLHAIPLAYAWTDGAVVTGPLYNETNVVDAVPGVSDIGVVWDPVHGLMAVDTRDWLASRAAGVACQRDISVRVLATQVDIFGTYMGQLVAYLPRSTVPHRVCRPKFGHIGGIVACRQLGFDTGRAYEPNFDTRDDTQNNNTLCVGARCAITDGDVFACAQSRTAYACCDDPAAVYVACELK